MVGVIAAKGGLQQLHTQRFNFIDILGSGKPAVDSANVPFRRARPNFGGKQGAHHLPALAGWEKPIRAE
jgi:hypothetical protein